MNNNRILFVYTTIVLCGLVTSAMGHGLMVDPPARNAHCGLNEKPDQATTPACVEAFESDFSGGYQFMSVLSHTTGRAGGTTENVCGFDSETWKGGPTPWDKPTDWPTTPMTSGPRQITWNISWGPHYDDTEEFRYYITKSDFKYKQGTALSWNDFESKPFCLLKYDDKNPTANPGIVADKNASLFHTTCNVPQRSSRHVIYGEWGRNHYTYERFHGCIDVAFAESTSSPTEPEPQNQAPIADSRTITVTAGANVTITPSGSDSDGEVVAYKIISQPSEGTLDDGNAGLVYTPNSGYTGTDSFQFTLTDNQGATSSPATISIIVEAGTDTATPVPPPGEELSANCEHIVSNVWQNGFQAAIRIINTGDEAIDGWQVNWEYTDGSKVRQLWGGKLSGSNPYTVGNVAWNAKIYPGQRVEFGFIGSGAPQSMPKITGDVCQ